MTNVAFQRAYIGLGSNLEAPQRHVLTALEELATLPVCRLHAHSRLYASQPLGPQDQPDFINAVAIVDTRLSPLALLDQLQALEQRHGRLRQRHWGPRTLDLDLLLYGNNVIDSLRLRIPHPEMTRRAFVLMPLAEIAPNLVLPDGRRIDAMVPNAQQDGLRVVLPER